MNISMQKLLQKMEDEIKNAKASSSEAKIRERIQAVKTLCELVLEEPERKQQQYEPVKTVPSQPVVVSQPKRLHVDDEANGESLFDF
jgi:hypothetical protein